MQTPFLLVWLAAVHQFMPVSRCFPVYLPDTPTLSPYSAIKGKLTTSVETRDNSFNLYLKATSTNSLVFLRIRTQTSDGVSILDFKRKRFLCVDVQGKLFSSMVSSIECLFKPTRRENYVDVFYSFKNRLLDGAEVHVKGHDRSTRQIVYRSKRSQQVHSVIPEAEPIAEDQYLDIQHIQERAGVISKETITSCDDPLRVLHSNSPGSPIKKAVEKTDAE